MDFPSGFNWRSFRSNKKEKTQGDDTDMTGDFVHSVFSMTTPIILAALGGMFTHLAGTLNIALEGLMLISAFVSIYFAELTGSILLAVSAGIGFSCFFSAIMAFLTIKLKANVFVVGLAINLMASGLTVFLGNVLLGSRGTITFPGAPKLMEINIPFIKDIPFLGSLLSGYNILELSVLPLAVFSALIIFRTPFGFHLRAAGKDSKAALNSGISPNKITCLSFLICGFFCGLSGAWLSLPLKTFVGGMSNGRGWIALVAIILGKENPFGVLLAALVFGFSSALSNQLQTITQISPKLLFTIPFITTLTAMIFFSVRNPLKKKRI